MARVMALVMALVIAPVMGFGSRAVVTADGGPHDGGYYDALHGIRTRTWANERGGGLISLRNDCSCTMHGSAVERIRELHANPVTLPRSDSIFGEQSLGRTGWGGF